MSEFIAVNDVFSISDHPGFKREALMFDRIAIPNFRKTLDGLHEKHPEKSALFAQYDWLLEHGVIFEPDIDMDEENLNNNAEYRQFYQSYLDHLSSMDALFQGLTLADVIDGKLLENDTKLTDKGEALWKSLSTLFGLQAREMSFKLRLLHGLDAYPILSSFITEMDDHQTDKDMVLQIVLNQFPIPDDVTPWEHIDEFRSDPDSRGKFLALKNWINEVARMELPSNEVEDKLKSAMFEYEQQLKEHRINFKWDVLKTIVYSQAFTGGGYLTGWGKLGAAIGVVKPLFTIRQEHMKLVAAERTAPGREVAYIIKSRETF
jgi:hypothetical protein